MGVVRAGLVTLPIGRTDLIPEDYEIVDKRVEVPIEPLDFKFDLRDSQQSVYDEVEGSCIINAWVSWGKTFTALAIANKLQQKTLIVTHTLALRSQWEKEVQKVFGVTAGVIGSGKFDIDSPFVVGNVQTLYRNVDKVVKEFGTIILDEMHHVSSPTFTRLIDASRAKNKIGLTGTLQRKDGRHVVFRDYFSSTVFKPPKENYLTPSIDIINSGIRFMDGNVDWATRVNSLAFDWEYQNTMAMLAASYAAKGHKVLLVADRVDFLKSCARLVGDNAICVTGDIPHEQRAEMVKGIFNDKDVLFGTQSIFSEGISLDCLSCLILGTPVNNEPLLTQLIGRVIRMYDGKLQPKVVDINLHGRTARKQAAARRGYYMRQGYEIFEV
ncbi:DEAD/DEAH box helicase family protein [bacterium]|nr:DEAD/DEAH box helicase family protein [bacterium]